MPESRSLERLGGARLALLVPRLSHTFDLRRGGHLAAECSISARISAPNSSISKHPNSYWVHSMPGLRGLVVYPSQPAHTAAGM